MEPTLEAEIRKAQLEDEKLKEIRQLIKDNKTVISLRMTMEPCGWENGYAFPILCLFGN
jgi:hypothetical protein